MYDNLNSFRAEMNNCAISSDKYEGLGTITGVSKKGDTPTISIYPADTQGSLENFFGSNGNYFIIRYIGSIPRMSYDYHVDGETKGKIFEIDPSGDLFAKLLFNPHDDLVTGTISIPIPIAKLTGDGINASNNSNKITKMKTLMITTATGIVDGNRKVIDIMSIVKGMRVILGRSYIDQTVYGTLRKKFTIELKDDTKILSFSFGNIVLDDGDVSATSQREKPTSIASLKNGKYKEQASLVEKMLESPNKIYNTEATI